MFELYHKGKKIALFSSREKAERYAVKNNLGKWCISERRWELH